MELMQNETAQLVALLSTRLAGIMAIAPVFSARVVPVRIRTAILLVLTVVLFPAARLAAGSGLTLSAPVFLSEALIGLTIGLGAAIFVGAAEAAGDMLAVQMGLSGANVLDPMAGTQMPVLGQFLGLFAVALILATGGHMVILEALAGSFQAFPPGQVLEFQGGPDALARIGAGQFVLGIRFAAPVVAAMMIGNAALGAMAKTVPQLNVLMMAFPLQIGIGLLTLGFCLPIIASFFAGWPGTFRGMMAEILDQYAVTGGIR